MSFTYKNVPAGLIASPNGLATPVKGDPGTGVSVPSALLILKAEIVPLIWLPTNTNFPAESTTTP